MKSFLVTYYFTNKEVYAIKYFNAAKSIEEFTKKIDMYGCLGDNNYKNFVNLKNVCRFTIDELEGDEK